MLKCEEDPYNSETRAGYVNLGTAVNALVEDIISDRLMKVHISDTVTVSQCHSVTSLFLPLDQQENLPITIVLLIF